MKTLLIIYSIVVFIFVANPALAVTAMQKQNTTEALSKFVADRKTPGLQYIFVSDTETLFQYQAGLANVAKKIPVAATTTFNGYSVTKTFTAAAVVNLALQKKIDLDQPIDSYIKGLAIENGPTVRQTLQHVGGFPNPNPISWIHRADQVAQFDEKGFVDEILRKHTKLESRPGEKFSYSNIGYIVLGELVHQVSGMPYDEYVSTELIKPIGLSNGQVISYAIDNPENHATGYVRRWNWLNLLVGMFIDRDVYLGKATNGWVPFNNILLNGKAYGGLVGNAPGFARYLQAMLRQEGPFTKEMLDAMWTTGKTSNGEPTRGGLAWFHGTLNGQRYYFHAGGGGGYYCEIRIYPDARRASVIMTNNSGVSEQNYLDKFDQFLLPNKKEGPNA